MKGLDLPGQDHTPDGMQGAPWWLRIQNIVLSSAFVVLTALILVMQFLPTDQVLLEVGDVSPRDIRAPQRKTYISQILTERERDRAEAMVRDVYDPPSARIARDQISYARNLFDYFSSLRQDPYSTPEEKISLIQSIPDLNLSSATITHLLNLSPQSWQSVYDQTLYVLDQTMRKEIRDNQVIEVRRTVPTLVSLDLSETEAEVVIALARGLIKPNSLYNVEKTAAAKRLARDSVSPITQTVEKGEVILRAGDIVTPEDVEALTAFGLRQVQVQWGTIVGAVFFALIVSVMLGLYIKKFTPQIFADQQSLPLFFTLLIVFIFGAKLMASGQSVISFIPYLFPVATLSILVYVFFGGEAAIGATVCLALIAGFVSNGSLEIATYTLIGGVAASLRLARVERVTILLWSGVYVALANVGVILAFRLPAPNYDAVGLATLLSVGMVNGILSASLALIGLLFLGNLFSVTTSLQLTELARPTHPLLRQLLLKAPGTYHHSLLVSNMAEQAAERIGADDLLARVGAYYHDIGKMLRPYFFVDNQVEGVNVHSRLDPQTSAQIVISHVRDGLDLGRKYRLPTVILDFVAQHHGTTVTTYFYRQATQMHNGPEMVDIRRFTYPGPRPRRKEIGIVMLADGCEAAVRAQRPDSPEKIDEIVRNIITERLVAGELNASALTMHDLSIIRASFVNILQGVFHPRVKYPESVQAEAQRTAAEQGTALEPGRRREEVVQPAAAQPGPPSRQPETLSPPIAGTAPDAVVDDEEEISTIEKIIRFRRG